MRRFDAILVADWSAAGRPRTGRDSIWVAWLSPDGEALENPATRAEAARRIAVLLALAAAAGRRVLAGFDFPFGFPAGTASALGLGTGWRALWAAIAGELSEGTGNANDRFDAAARLNARAGTAPGPFWGNGLRREIPRLPRRRPGGYGTRLPPLRRRTDAAATGAQEVWKLSGAGAPGGQALTGIAMLERLRRDPRLAGRIAVWPFEGGLALPASPLVLAEVYPSLVAPDPSQEVKDAGQVLALARVFRDLDARGGLAPLFAGPAGAGPEDRAAIEAEEGWVLGAGHLVRPARAARAA